MISFTETEGTLTLTVTAQPMGQGLNVSLFGGDDPHIGAVALAEPRPSLRGDGGSGASCSVLTRLGHKEDELARRVALDLAAHMGIVVCVVCGIHIRGADEESIRGALVLADRLVGRLREAAAAGGQSDHV